MFGLGISNDLRSEIRSQPERHHDFIDVIDFSGCRNELDLIVEVEAKPKAPALLKLKADLEQLHSPK
jgi:UV DNA damage repair endonuclease